MHKPPHYTAVLFLNSRGASARMTAGLWLQAVAIAQFSRCLQVFSGSHQLSDLPDMSQIVHGPLMQHLLQGDFAGLRVPGAAFTGASRQGPQILQVTLALLFKT